MGTDRGRWKVDAISATVSLLTATSHRLQNDAVTDAPKKKGECLFF